MIKLDTSRIDAEVEELKAKANIRKMIKQQNKIELTYLEKDVILHGIGDNEYDDAGNGTWSWSIQPNCKVVTLAQIKGVISSLVKKGLAITYNYEGGKNPKDDVVRLTEEGKEVLNRLRAEA